MVKLSSAGRKALDDFVAQTKKDNTLSSFSIAVSSVDEELYISSVGHKLCNDPTSGPVTPDSMFWMCSMAKMVSALAALQLIEQGKLDPNDPVSKYLPEFKDLIIVEGLFTPNITYKPAQGIPTIAHLLTHSSGLSYLIDLPNPPWALPDVYTFEQGPTTEATITKMLALIKKGHPGIPLAFEPGTSFAYGFSSDILGAVVGRVTGIAFADYCEKEIFKALGIEATFKLTAESNERLVGLSYRNPDGTLSQCSDEIPLNHRYPKEVHLALGGVGLYSTVPGYLHLLRHLLAIEAGKEPVNSIVKRETVKQLFQPKLTPEGAETLRTWFRMANPLNPDPNFDNVNWGNGVAISTADWPGKRKANSGFWSGLAGTCFLMDPTTGIALISAAQVFPGPDVSAMTLFDKLEEIVYANLED